MKKASKNLDIKLRNELVWLVVAKLVLLSLIWWFFFSDQRVSVDPHAMGSQVVSGTRTIVTGDK